MVTNSETKIKVREATIDDVYLALDQSVYDTLGRANGMATRVATHRTVVMVVDQYLHRVLYGVVDWAVLQRGGPRHPGLWIYLKGVAR